MGASFCNEDAVVSRFCLRGLVYDALIDLDQNLFALQPTLLWKAFREITHSLKIH